MTERLAPPPFQFRSAVTRRAVLGGVAGAAGLAMASGAGRAADFQQVQFSELKPRQTGEGGHIRYAHLTFSDPVQRMRTATRLEHGLGDGTYLWWYTFMLFGVTPNRSPIPLVRFEGMEISEWRRSGENNFIVHGHNVSFPQDWETGAYLESWENPLTGARVKTEPTLLTSDPGREKTPAGDIDLAARDRGIRPATEVFRIEGDLIHKDDIRTPPENWPGQFIEMNTVTGSLDALMTTDDPSIAARGSGAWVQPFLKWMNMKGVDGHMMGYFNGRKLPSVEALPKPFYNRLMAEHRELARVDPAKFTEEYWKVNQSGLLNVEPEG